ncbi:type II toxin-antitoxin system RelE/ParE family toxin [Mitsuaria sp. GD03876]|uniref:type II toxin-antitoxin system RelE/ParE family toxin n=1 Tax=Mitsuaria sp. GD03876 TaxID=2975399 RepID=UPI00244991F3|nr:type II toxin-antitoxin system RelE/ParE family toxin [Mitsuaria sp. GD03876]MDH0866841.1 type II toxin-antitoxin system RelE/ParE family toxin [Mitsuaria sp. GD03876]
MEVDVAVYAVKVFRRWMQKEGLADRDICCAVVEMSRGLIDARLGRGLFKKRIARNGQGKRGAYRTIVATLESGHWFFIYGFAKSDQENISSLKEVHCRLAARQLLSMNAEQREDQVAIGELSKVECHAQVSKPL